MEIRRTRAKRLAAEQGISRELFCEKTGYSPDQWYYWFGSGSRTSSPSTKQLQHICECLDWSANYILFGVGNKSLGTIKVANDNAQWIERVKRIEQGVTENSRMLSEILKRLDV